jgi:hypothetical protein
MQGRRRYSERQGDGENQSIELNTVRKESGRVKSDALVSNSNTIMRASNVTFSPQRSPRGKRTSDGKERIAMRTGRSKIPLMSTYTDADELMDDMLPFLHSVEDGIENSGLPMITAQDAATLLNRLKQQTQLKT